MLHSAAKFMGGHGDVMAGGYDAAARTASGCRLITRPVAAAARPDEGLLRLSIGLEHVEDLWQDLAAAL